MEWFTGVLNVRSHCPSGYLIRFDREFVDTKYRWLSSMIEFLIVVISSLTVDFLPRSADHGLNASVLLALTEKY